MAKKDSVDIYTVIGMNIKKYRKQRGFTQRTLSEALMLSESFIAKLESKTYQTISIDTLQQIADLLNVDIICFFDRCVLDK